jgi:MFS transporter, FSR family, fosmidomycin resistance protein
MADPATSLPMASSVEAIEPERAGLGARLAAVVVSHTLVDVYSAFLPPLLAVLEVRCKLTAVQTAWLLGIGSLTSGLSQPIAAWLSDRIDSRVCGSLGLALAAVCLSAIGLADSYWTLVTLYAIGMIGSGIYHPIGAASMGQLSAQLPGSRRAMGISVFHAAGMVGGIAGSLIATRLTSLPEGFDLLRWLMIPGLVTAGALHMLIRGASHRAHAHHAIRFSDGEASARWHIVAMLYLSNAIRFAVNVALVYLFVRWAQDFVERRDPSAGVQRIAAHAAQINGNLNAFLLVGMMIGGISAGALVRSGREKWPMVLVPVVFAPCIALLPHASVTMAYVMAIGAGIAFAAMVPVSISLAQRMLPHRTSLASGLMLGGAWALAFVGPRIAEWCMASGGMSLAMTFAITAGALVVSSLVCLPMDAGLLRRSTMAQRNGS